MKQEEERRSAWAESRGEESPSKGTEGEGGSAGSKVVTGLLSVPLVFSVFVLLSACGWAFDDRETCSERAGSDVMLLNANHPEAAFWYALDNLFDSGCKRDNAWKFWD